MRISDWSSDVCSSDLIGQCFGQYRRPFGTAKAAPDRQLPVAPHDRVDERQRGEQGIAGKGQALAVEVVDQPAARRLAFHKTRSEEHTSEIQSLMRNSYAVFCLKKKRIHDIDRSDRRQPTQT